MSSTAHRPDASIFLATPAFGGLASIHFFNALLRLQRACDARGVGLQIELNGGDALITRARSRLATQFLEATSHSHLLFVDADIAFDPQHVFRLIEADKDLVGGVYPLKKVHWEKVAPAVAAGVKDLQAASLGYVVRFLQNADCTAELDDQGFGRVASVGTGFMLIRRPVLERIQAACPQLRCLMTDVGRPAEAATLFFETMIDPDTGEHLSEDYAFCRRWRDLGGEVWADFRTRMSHVGHAVYTGSLTDAVAT